MRILVVSNMYPSARHGYFGVFVRDRVEAYRRAGADVRVVAKTEPPGRKWRVLAQYLTVLAKTVWFILRRRPDVIEAHYLAPTGVIVYLATRLRRIPYVLYAHGSDVRMHLPGPLLRLVGRSVRAAAEVHTNSAATADALARRFRPVSPPLVIPPGVDLSRFVPAPERFAAQTVVFVGNLVELKGLDVLLRALARPAFDEVMLKVAGDGPEAAGLRSLARSLDREAVWLERVAHDRLPELLGRAHVVAVPSRRESLGQVAIEALACGTPIVVSDVGGLGAIPDRDSGSVVAPEDEDALAAAVLHWLGVMRSLPERPAAAARHRAAMFSLDAVVSETLDRYRRIGA